MKRQSSTHQYELHIRNAGRSISDQDWESIDAKHIEVWASAVHALAPMCWRINETGYEITANWKPLASRYKRRYSAMRRVESNVASSKQPFLGVRFPQRTRVSITVKSQQTDDTNTPSIAARYCHDVFLIMNLCAPACFDLYMAKLETNHWHEPDVSLSNIHFDSALELQLENTITSPVFLEPHKVVSWYYTVMDPASQLPDSPITKALYAILHLAQSDLNPMSVIWIFYALESLFQTRAGENFSSLVNRISLLLELEEGSRKDLRKGLRRLYDVRSAVVHGGFQITHVLHNELIDKRVDESFRDTIDIVSFGSAVLVASLQRIIRNGWHWLTFEEQILGVSVPPGLS